MLFFHIAHLARADAMFAGHCATGYQRAAAYVVGQFLCALQFVI